MANRLSLHSLACLALDTLAMEARHCENDVPYAMWYAQQAAAAAAKSGDMFSMQNAALRLLSLETWRGNVERMVALERQAGELRTTDASRGVYIVESQAYRSAWTGRFGEAHAALATVLDRVPHEFDKIMLRATYALCLALDGAFKESKEQVSALFAAIDAEKPEPNGFASLALEIAQLLGFLSEIVSGRKTLATNLLKRRPVLSDRPGAEAMREATVHLLRGIDRAVSLGEIADALESMEHYGLGGFARLVQASLDALERVQLEEDSPRGKRLTEAEAQVVRLLAEGLSTKDIALETSRSVMTVQTHIKRAIAKLGCHGKADLLRTVRERGLDTLVS